MTPAQPAITYGEYGPDGIGSGNPLGLILSSDLSSGLSSGLSPADLPDDTELPYEDGIPLESNWHRHQMNLLIELIEYHWRKRHDFFAGGNMFIYFDRYRALSRNYRGPDFFVVKNTTHNPTRKSWIAWKEAGKLPNVIVELASPSTIRFDLTKKKELYEKEFRTPEYFCYDPETLTLYGWRLQQGCYVPIPMDAQGRMFSQEMGLKIGAWQGEHLRYRTTWLRLYTPDGQLVTKFSEAEAQRAEAEAQKAKAEAERATVADRRAKFEAQRADAEARKSGLLEAELNRLKALMAEKGVVLPG